MCSLICQASIGKETQVDIELIGRKRQKKKEVGEHVQLKDRLKQTQFDKQGLV